MTAAKALEDVFAAALEQPPERREAFIRQACTGQPEQQAELLALLPLDEPAAEYFSELEQRIASAAPMELETAEYPAPRIGPYQARSLLGQGGMGVVYRAERVDGAFEQQVALKLLHLDMDTPAVRARFLHERQILAGLEHPNIARLLDGGVTDEGRPFFVMEYIAGRPITRYVHEQRPSLPQLLRLFLEVINAVRYLHRNLVVHRDLKPGNILVDASGQIKLVDFGIAKLLAADSEPLTQTGEQPLTPEYAAPEQLINANVTTSADVYALGVVLYELLAGVRPHDHGASVGRRRWRELPTPPSHRLRALPGKTSSHLAWRSLRGDLDNICLMALRPEPEQRYASVEQMGADIEHYLAGHAVMASGGAMAYRSRKFLQRYWRQAAVAAALVILLGFGLLRERQLRGSAETARAEAQAEAAKATAISEFLRELLGSVDPAVAQGREVAVADVLDQAAQRLRAGGVFTGQPEVERTLRQTIGSTYAELGQHSAALEQLQRALQLSPKPSADAEAVALAIVRVHRYRQEWALAEDRLRPVLAARIARLGEDHPETLAAQAELANILWSQRRYTEVEALDRALVRAMRRTHGPDHPDTLMARSGLASTLFSQGRLREATGMYQQVLAPLRQQLGPRHPKVLKVHHNLATALSELGRHREAVAELRQLQSERSSVLGDGAFDAATSMQSLALALVGMGEYAEAEQWYRRAIEARLTLDGEAGRSVYYTRSLLADALRDAGRLDEAEQLYRDCREWQSANLPTEHSDRLRTLGGLAELRLRQGRKDEAETLAVDVLARTRALHGEVHLFVLEIATTLGRIRNQQGAFEQSIALLEPVVLDARKAFGESHMMVLAAQLVWAEALLAQGADSRAAQLAQEAIDGNTTVLGAEHPLTQAARKLLENATDSVGRRRYLIP